MAGKEAKVISIDRLVDADLNISDFRQRPAQVRQWFTDNVVKPVFSYMVGWTGTKAVMLLATTAGVLKVANVGSGLERVESKTGIASSIESAGVEFTNTMSKIRVVVNDYDMYLRPSYDGSNYEDQIHLKADVEQSFDLTCKAFKVQRYGVNDASYEIEGYR